jgi:hypothetical protein
MDLFHKGKNKNVMIFWKLIWCTWSYPNDKNKTIRQHYFFSKHLVEKKLYHGQVSAFPHLQKEVSKNHNENGHHENLLEVPIVTLIL